MRRSLLLAMAAGTLAITGCQGLKDAFSPQANVVASAGNAKLETDRLVQLLSSVPSGSVTPDGVRFLAALWVDLNLFAENRINGTLGEDSATVARVMWPQILQARMQAWQDTLAARREKPTDASADSAYDDGTVRVFQHIIVQPSGTSARDSAAARSRIQTVLGQVRRGGDFGALAGQNADASKSDQGYLPVGPRGQFVPEFEDAAWKLEPGQVSDVVQSSFGWHLIRRPAKEEARQRFRDFLSRTTAQRADSIYVAGLTRDNELKLTADVGKKVKDAAADLDLARRNTTNLVTFKKGSFTVRDFVRWMEALPPGASNQIQAQPDSVLSGFVEGLAQNTLVIRAMDSAKLGMAEADWQALQLSYRATIDQLAAGIGLTDSVVSDTTRPKAARLDSARARVNVFLDNLMAGRAQFRPLPGSLSGYLRENNRYRLNRAGLARAVELVQARAKADSAAGKGAAPSAPGPIQPAPGGPPVGGAQEPNPKP
ncbi:MAG: PpiC-type peptidyl-prolyl cis-trans isomerase [Gemmatimonadetes bacterium]|nr:PpiC-type peptidyl-prolyl cis-trans isomerase [Gemmatimonadota bacterium]